MGTGSFLGDTGVHNWSASILSVLILDTLEVTSSCRATVQNSQQLVHLTSRLYSTIERVAALVEAAIDVAYSICSCDTEDCVAKRPTLHELLTFRKWTLRMW
jgi:hypothetical protein